MVSSYVHVLLTRSQVSDLFLFFFIGFNERFYRIVDNDEFNEVRVANRSKNTFLLALDGDIDFQPEAVHLLIQYMKKKDNLGAACGRIHPVGRIN